MGLRGSLLQLLPSGTFRFTLRHRGCGRRLSRRLHLTTSATPSLPQNQLVYRASAALMIVFGVIALGTYGYAPMHTGLWAIKYMSVYLIWFLFMFCKNHGFDKLVSFV